MRKIKEVKQTLPNEWVDIIYQSLKANKAALESLDLENEEIHNKVFDINQLIGMMSCKKLEITFNEYQWENYNNPAGSDYPEFQDEFAPRFFYEPSENEEKMEMIKDLEQQERNEKDSEITINVLSKLAETGISPSDLQMVIAPDFLDLLSTLDEKNKSLDTVLIVAKAFKFELMNSDDYWSDLHDKVINLLN